MFVRKSGIAFICALALLLATGQTSASTIVSPISVVQNTLGERNPNVVLANAFDQSGLSSGYTSGVTDFDIYLAGSPSHSLVAFGGEWFAPDGVTSGVIDFDLGSVLSIDRVAIWNEDATGVKDLNVYTSNDSTFATSTLVGGFTLTNNVRDVDYLADVLGLTTTNARYVRIEILSAYADNLNVIVPTASLGEIAFSTNPIPEPHSAILFGIGAFLVGGRVTRKLQAAP